LSHVLPSEAGLRIIRKTPSIQISVRQSVNCPCARPDSAEYGKG